ncbi:NAD(P)/FAD-dependent oxidoreductase [Microbispora sp. ATCC PTA-5024]|uniref:NAD(P)/FAD-dependent oxidoreductase n=1 Tax=Microbispora sp. ATCC PTA-5024 TaxID=316330 RepID=UPI0003DDCE4A|nr:NAD(P)/FAD-dependent oxidoreductase [Microbispora sp. ATCC PTA-5024]ETK38086.1 monooxygenase [Microbispora sp. ATCC PTA-5024]
MIDVLVAGGGPAGLATAIHAALSGLEAVVVEPRAGALDKACGEGLMPTGAAALRDLGVTVPQGVPFRGIRYVDGAHRAQALFRDGPGLGVRRTALHAALLLRAEETGVRVVRGRVDGLRQEPDRVAVTLRRPARAGVESRQETRRLRASQADGPDGAREESPGAVREMSPGGALEGFPGGAREGSPGTAWGEFPGTASEGFPRMAREGSSEMVEARWLVAADGLHSPVRAALGLGLPVSGQRRYGLRRHYRIAPWTDFVEVHWAPGGEAYVTPVGDDLVGVAVLSTRRRGYDEHLAEFPDLLARLDGPAATAVRGAGPLRQRVRSRVAGRVLLVGDAAGYVDALTGEGLSLALLSAGALVRCLRDGRPDAYEAAWRRLSLRSRLLTAALLEARRHPACARLVVPAAQRLPAVFRAAVRALA